MIIVHEKPREGNEKPKRELKFVSYRPRQPRSRGGNRHRRGRSGASNHTESSSALQPRSPKQNDTVAIIEDGSSSIPVTLDWVERHPYIDNALGELRIPGLLDVKSLCWWIATHDLVAPRNGVLFDWICEVKSLWGKVLWDWCLQEPLIFYLQLLAVLEKRSAMTAIDHDSYIAQVYTRFLPQLRSRLLQYEVTTNGLEAVAVTGMIYLNLRRGNIETAEMHASALPKLVQSKTLDRDVWLYTHWQEMRLAGLTFRYPRLPWYIPEGWPTQDRLSQSEQAEVREDALRAVKVLGSLTAEHRNEFFRSFQQLFEANKLQETTKESMMRQMHLLYTMTYDACCLHADTHPSNIPVADLLMPAILIELMAVAIKLSVWNVAWTIGPQSGNIQRANLRRAQLLVESLSRGTDAKTWVSTLASFKASPRLLLWIFLVLCAESFTFWPRMRPRFLALFHDLVVELKIKTRAALQSAVELLPCTGQPYQARISRAWTDLDVTLPNSSWREIGSFNTNESWTNATPRRPGFDDYLTSMNFQIRPE